MNFQMLKSYLMEHGALPKEDGPNKALYHFVVTTRKQLLEFVRLGKNQPAEIKRKRTHQIAQLRSIGIDILQDRWKPNAGCWEPVILKEIVTANDKEDEDEEVNFHLFWLMSQLEVFTATPGWSVNVKFRTITEYVLWCLNVGDIKPEECTRACKIYTIQYLLSYIRHPEVILNFIDIPTKTHVKGVSSYFGHNLISGEVNIRILIEKLMTELPEWLTRMYNKYKEGKRVYAKEDLVTLIREEPTWFAHFPVSVLGTNPNGGSKPLTHTKQPGPRRLLLSAQIHGRVKSDYHKCDLEELYGYSYSFVPRPWMGVRCLRDFPTVAELGVLLWKRVHPHLDPVSQTLPPNSANILTYFGDFDGHINAHQDNAPNMAIDPQHNSQLLGSSVMVLNLCHAQDFHFVALHDKNKVEDTFVCEHGSVYILRADDDLNYKHTARFSGDKVGKVRIAIVFRWLGRRTKAFCDNYRGQRQYMEVFYNIDKHIFAKFPKSVQSRKIFRAPTRGMDKARFPPESIDVGEVDQDGN